MTDDGEQEPKAARPFRLSLVDKVRLARRLEHRAKYQKSLTPEQRERTRLGAKRLRLLIERYGPD